MKFDKSYELHKRACKTAPGGIHSNVRKMWHPTPMFYERGQGSHVWDVDGNEFIDYVLARGPLLLGHSPQPVLDAVKKQMDVGLMYAGQHPLEIEAAEKFVELVPGADMVRFSSSGSEAVHAAVRLARALTGRAKIMRFEGHYHGWFDNIFYNFAPPLDKAGPRENPIAIPVSKGQSASDAENLIIRPWNDLDIMKNTFAQHASEIAAVLCEAIVCNSGCIMPQPGYLEGLRELCTKHGALLIFDEVITGFRVSLGGAQEYFDIIPDLATFAKGMAAGFAVSAVAGKAEYMQAFGDLTVTHAGTYNSNGPCMAACIASMQMLAAGNGELLKQAHFLGAELMNGLVEAGNKAGKPICVQGVPTVFSVTFNETEEVVDYRSYALRDTQMGVNFMMALQERGIRATPDGLWFVSTAHTPEDIDRTVAAASEALKEI